MFDYDLLTHLDYDVLTPNEKIKNIMIALRMTQEDMAGGLINRSIISKIINNKRKVNSDNAEKLAITINKFMEDNNIEETITAEWILESEQDQVGRIILKHLSDLDKIVKSKDEDLIMGRLKLIRDIIVQYGVKNDIALKAIDSAYLALRAMHKFDMALQYIELYAAILLSDKGLDDSIKFSKVLENCRRLTFTLLQLKEYYSIISVAKNAYFIIDKYKLNKPSDRTSMHKITRNLALAYKNIGEFDKCISCLENIITDTSISKDDELYSYNQIADVLIKLGKFSEAEKPLLYLETESKHNKDNNLVISVLQNICFVYLGLNNKQAAKKYEGKLMAIDFNTMDKIDKARNLYYLLIIEVKLNEKDSVRKLYKECFRLAAELQNKTMQYKAIKFTAQYFIDSDMKSSLMMLVNFIDENFKDIISNEIEKVVSEIAEDFRGKDEKKREEIVIKATRIRRKFNLLNGDYDI